jgi:GMP synthase-like glutamine amidotransferase
VKGLRALVIQHEQPTPGGYVNQWLEDRGADQEIFRIDIDDSERDPREYNLIVSLGSEFAAFDDIAWIRREEAMLREAQEAEVPILGVCFGGQLLAKTLGGNAFRSDKSEIGWLPVRTRDDSLVPPGPWFQWHFDSFTPPPGANLIADSQVGPQAYTIGRSLGTQFHPEVTPEIMEAWVRVYPHELEQEGVDPQRLLEETYERADETRASAWRFFDAFLDRVARNGTGAASGR